MSGSARPGPSLEDARERVVLSITRRPDELLVFEHGPEFPDAGLQVPGGGLDPGETPLQAAVREALEETGLRLTGPTYLCARPWARGGRSERWHFVHLWAAADTPDAWSQRVSAGEQDAGMIFHQRFAPLHDPGLTPGHGDDAALSTLLQHLSTPRIQP